MNRDVKQGPLLGGAIILLYLFKIRKMNREIDIPDFMKPDVCAEPGCTKRALPKIGKCLECAVEEHLPKLYDDLEEITRVKK
jgi:hypothetical protein